MNRYTKLSNTLRQEHKIKMALKIKSIIKVVAKIWDRVMLIVFFIFMACVAVFTIAYVVANYN